MAARAKRALVAFLRFALLKGRTQVENRPQALVFLVAVAITIVVAAVAAAVKMGLPVIRCLLVDQVIMIKPTLIV